MKTSFGERLQLSSLAIDPLEPVFFYEKEITLQLSLGTRNVFFSQLRDPHGQSDGKRQRGPLREREDCLYLVGPVSGSRHAT